MIALDTETKKVHLESSNEVMVSKDMFVEGSSSLAIIDGLEELEKEFPVSIFTFRLGSQG